MKTLGLRALFVSVTLGLATAGAAHAQLNDQLNDFWEDVNEHSNVTPPQAYMGQQGGYFTGGSLVYRAEQNTLQPFTADEGADYHCQPLARLLTDERMFDWLDTRLGR